MKKAYIIEFSSAVRVVVDVPKDKVGNSPKSDDELWGLIAHEAVEILGERITRVPGIVEEDIISISDDMSEPA